MLTWKGHFCIPDNILGCQGDTCPYFCGIRNSLDLQSFAIKVFKSSYNGIYVWKKLEQVWIQTYPKANFLKKKEKKEEG
jgi:hypothetical protein